MSHQVKKNSPEILELRRAVENSIKHKICTPADFEFLSGAIWERIHKTISTSTLKRLWGYVDGADNTRRSTQQLLSEFIGFSSWEEFVEHVNNQSDNQSAILLANGINTNNLNADDRLEICWQPNRKCIIRYLGNTQFIVEESENSKLKAGDRFCCSFFILHQPLYIDNLIHGKNIPVAFVAGKKDGLTVIQKIN